jgi:CRISPR-associated protein Csy1
VTSGRADARKKLERARAMLAAGDIAGARAVSDAVAKRGVPSDAAFAHLLLAACARRSSDPEAARRHVEAALRNDPDNALAHYAHAEHLEQHGDAAAAIASLEQAVRLQPGFVAAHQLLGVLRGERGEHQRAAEAFRRAVTLDPGNARGYNNLGNALRSLGQLDEARAAFERALALRPDYELAAANVAAAWRDAGEPGRAERLLRSTLQRPSAKPPRREVVVILAGLLRERGAFDEAEPLYRQAIEMAPAASAAEWFNLGRLYAEHDEPHPAREAFARSYAMDRRDARGAIAARLNLPITYDSAHEVSAARERYATGLSELHAMADEIATGLTSQQALDSLRWTNFFLAYQGRADRELQASYATFAAKLVERCAPEWRAPLPPRHARSRLRVGFASSFFHTGTAGRYFRSWITELPRERFEVFVYHLLPGMDDIATQIESRAERFVEFGGTRARPSVVAPVIRDDELDVLVYPELGMDHTAFALAALRLAPRQIVGWGHPVTTGHSTIDAFVTCGAMEPSDAQRDYSEPLVRLPGIGTSYRRLVLPDPASRDRLGLPDDRVLLLCPQSLFKVHPDNDALFAAVLAANPRATLVMFQGEHRRVADRVQRRMMRMLESHGLSAGERIIMLPLLDHDEYLRINLACDAMLDTLYWSGGNTSLDAIACGLPVVTLPGALMRGRQSMAMLQLIGVPELVANDSDDYVQLATRLVRDEAWRAELRDRIRDGAGALFDDPAPCRAFADLLLEP